MTDTTTTDDSATWLAMDTSTSTMTLAVMRGSEVLGESDSAAERNHSIKLLPAVQELLQSLQLRMKDLDGVAVGQGPGSYTGVRIAVTVAKTFAWSLSIPLVGVSSLEALARGGWRQIDIAGYGEAGTETRNAFGAAADAGMGTSGVKTWIVPLMDARREQAFTSLYGFDGTKWAPLAADGIRLMSDWLSELGERLNTAAAGMSSDSAASQHSSWMPDRIVFVGETELFKELIAQKASAFSVKAEVQPTQMKAYDVAALGKQKWARGETEDVHPFVPNYTQLAEAEKKLLAKQ